MDHDKWMLRCLLLARNGAGKVGPNPMVGCVLVRNNELLAEGWHREYGGPHAEVECLNAYGTSAIPSDAWLYVNLEPCAHHGKTPPCTDLLIHRNVKHVVVGQLDPFPAVSGKGIQHLRSAGIDVSVGILEDQCRWLQRRFLKAIAEERPYFILKWAQSADGYLDKHPRTGRAVQRISCKATDVLVHQWRAEEDAILVGSRTVVNDDPELTVRHVAGRSPLRLIIDRKNSAPMGSNIFNDQAKTLLITNALRTDVHAQQLVLRTSDDAIERMIKELTVLSIRSVIVEGGSMLLQQFIDRGLWDEARIIKGSVFFQSGTPAPRLGSTALRTIHTGKDTIDLHLNTGATAHTPPTPAPEWSW